MIFCLCQFGLDETQRAQLQIDLESQPKVNQHYMSYGNQQAELCVLEAVYI